MPVYIFFNRTLSPMKMTVSFYQTENECLAFEFHIAMGSYKCLYEVGSNLYVFQEAKTSKCTQKTSKFTQKRPKTLEKTQNVTNKLP